MRRITVPFLLLTTLLVLVFGFVLPAAAEDEARICGPKDECVWACRARARAAWHECIRQGERPAVCGHRAHALRRACLMAECEPRPSCEKRCELHGMRLLQRCLEDGGELERCEAEAKMATESCIEEACRPCVCPDVYDPVCGTDGMTYGNACRAGCADVQILHEGPCEPKCDPLPCDVFCEFGHRVDDNGCPTCECNPPPGCESDEECKEGQVCRQICSLRPCTIDEPDCAPCFGVCVPRPDPCACPEIYQPVCGVDGRTYDNGCFARCAQVMIRHEGECRDSCRDNADCSDGTVCFPPTHECQPRCAIQCLVYDPVCGTDGVTYGCGEADAHCNGVEVAYDGECTDECGVNATCP